MFPSQCSLCVLSVFSKETNLGLYSKVLRKLVVPAAAQQSFLEHEALVHTQLSQLIKDGVWLKSYISAVMRVEQNVRLCVYGCMYSSPVHACQLLSPRARSFPCSP
jgi:hypothetical protein